MLCTRRKPHCDFSNTSHFYLFIYFSAGFCFAGPEQMARLSEHGIRLSSVRMGKKPVRSLLCIHNNVPVCYTSWCFLWLQMSPSYLDSNSTSHTWPFSAVAELIGTTSTCFTAFVVVFKSGSFSQRGTFLARVVFQLRSTPSKMRGYFFPPFH